MVKTEIKNNLEKIMDIITPNFFIKFENLMDKLRELLLFKLNTFDEDLININKKVKLINLTFNTIQHECSSELEVIFYQKGIEDSQNIETIILAGIDENGEFIKIDNQIKQSIYNYENNLFIFKE